MPFNKKEPDNNIDLLNYVFQNAKMGSQSISQLLPKISDQNFQSTLMQQLSEYQGIINQANDMLTDLNVTPKECIVDKLGSKAGIAFNTLTDTSTSHIAEMMITGSTMGVIDITKKINECPDCKKEVADLCNNLVQIEEQNAEDLKKFL